MTERDRVVVTGVGVVTGAFTGGSPALGAFLAAPHRAAVATAPGVAADDDRARDVGVGVGDNALGALIEAGEARRMTRVSRFAVAAARLALRDAGLDADSALGLVVGTEFGDLRSTREFADGYLDRGPAGLSALLFPSTVMNTMASATSIAVRAREASLTLNAPGVSGELAVARAASAVASGRLSVALAGGVDQLDAEIIRFMEQVGGRMEIRGEGATFLVLETRSAAERRAATILGELAGWAWRAAPARPHGVGRDVDARAITAAAAAAGCPVADIRWVYRSASGDLARDRWEERVLAQGLGGPRRTVSLAERVGQHAGLGALRVAAAAWTARAGLLPADGGAPVTPVDRGPGLVHGLARGGTHVALVVAAP